MKFTATIEDVQTDQGPAIKLSIEVDPPMKQGEPTPLTMCGLMASHLMNSFNSGQQIIAGTSQLFQQPHIPDPNKGGIKLSPARLIDPPNGEEVH